MKWDLTMSELDIIACVPAIPHGVSSGGDDCPVLGGILQLISFSQRPGLVVTMEARRESAYPSLRSTEEVEVWWSYIENGDEDLICEATEADKVHGDSVAVGAPRQGQLG